MAPASPPGRRRRRGRRQQPWLEPIEPFATGGLEAPTSPVRTRRLRPPDLSWLRRVLWPAIDHFVSDQGMVLAGYIAFTALFAVFPFIVFLVSLAGAWGQSEAAQESIAIALQILPPEVAGVLEPVVAEVRTAPHGTLITFSVALTIWFASSGLESLRHALNQAYGVTDPPSFWANRIKSMIMTVAAAGLMLGATGLIVGLPIAREIIAWMSEQDVFEQNLYTIARYVVGFTMFSIMTIGLYILLPNIRLRLRDVLPGAIVSITIWAVSTVLYSIYLQSFGRYSILYGSLGGVIFTLFYFYISAIIFIFGAQLNAAIMNERAARNARTLAKR